MRAFYNLDDITEEAVKSIGKWCVMLSYTSLEDESLDIDLPKFLLDTLGTHPLHRLISMHLPFNRVLLAFADEEEATAFFQLFPEGHQVYAGIYNSEGEAIDENT